jgi:hypothetical protein
MIVGKCVLSAPKFFDNRERDFQGRLTSVYVYFIRADMLADVCISLKTLERVCVNKQITHH